MSQLPLLEIEVGHLNKNEVNQFFVWVIDNCDLIKSSVRVTFNKLIQYTQF